MSILEVTKLSHTFGDKKLFNQTNLDLYDGDKMGLTGLNGAGKSTFINILMNKVIPDEGHVNWNSKMKIGYLDQQLKIESKLPIMEYLRQAFQDLINIDEQLEKTNLELESCDNPEKQLQLIKASGRYQTILEKNNYYAINSEIQKVAAGLGITALGLDTPMNKLSGGQKIKVMLAKILLEKPDVLLLDEPTNFLDKTHIDWLAKYLSIFRGSFLIVSHDFNFLDRVVNCICDIEFGQITRYNGNYNNFVKQKEERKTQYLKNFSSQQKEIERLEDYISRNSARASTAKMAKSRQKQLDKIQVIEKPTESIKPIFSFKFKPIAGKTLLTVDKLTIGYSAPLLPEISFKLDMGEKIAITGFNGIGKTTLLKTICGIIPSIGGDFHYHDKALFGYYEQENMWGDDKLTPVSYMKQLFPTFCDADVRKALSKCGIRSKESMQEIATLSGGEQAKVKLCSLIFKPYTALILDEPTNHLDVYTIKSLKEAIREFKGCVIFVSHDKEFCEQVADKVLNLESLFD